MKVGEIQEAEESLKPENEGMGFIADKILYEMCQKYPKHNNPQEIFAKIWLIGRSYAVALERGSKENEDDNNLFYEKAVAVLKESELDLWIESLKGKELSNDNLESILSVYKKLHDKTKEFDRGQKHSFCSKYLHFHLPKLFFIYDSRAVNEISKFKIDISELNDLKKKYNELPYSRFFCQCFILQKTIEDKFGKQLTPRQIDMLLLNNAI